MNYARNLPQDKTNNTYNGLPAFTAYQAQAGVPIASSVISLTDKTTVIDFTVLAGTSDGAILGKWGPSSVTSTNFDFVVASSTTRTLVVPQSVFGVNSVAGINVQMGLYNTVSVKTATGSASVFTAEY